MFLTVLAASAAIEHSKYRLIGTCDGRTVALSLSSGLFAVLMMLSEYSLLLNSSAVVLMIGGVLKELLTIALGVVVFGEVVGEKAAFGFGVVCTGVVVYKLDKLGKCGKSGEGKEEEEEERKKDGRGTRIPGSREDEDEDMTELMTWTAGDEEDP
jgi:hypothetical protein